MIYNLNPRRKKKLLASVLFDSSSQGSGHVELANLSEYDEVRRLRLYAGLLPSSRGTTPPKAPIPPGDGSAAPGVPDDDTSLSVNDTIPGSAPETTPL